MARTVITRSMVDDLLAGGTTELRLDAGAIVTSLAAEHAQERGLRLIRARDGEARSTEGAGSAAAAPRGPAADHDHDAVRRAVVAALGHEPGGLDAIIDRVIKG